MQYLPPSSGTAGQTALALHPALKCILPVHKPTAVTTIHPTIRGNQGRANLARVLLPLPSSPAFRASFYMLSLVPM